MKLLACSLFAALCISPAFGFEQQTIDDAIKVGYGLAIGDVDGDGKDDILLADAKEIVWYQNPSWKKHLIAKNLTLNDNVCIAARDLDGDGKVEIAVGANWNPGNTVDEKKSGSVHFLVRPEDPTTRWGSVRLPNEPTVHRMHWAKDGDGNASLVVLPLHGRGNKGGAGENNVKIYAYNIPLNDPSLWRRTLLDESLHVTHNFDITHGENGDTLHIGGKEGVVEIAWKDGAWNAAKLPLPDWDKGAGEVRSLSGDTDLIATVEPFHGNALVTYEKNVAGEWKRSVLSEALSQGHALAIADVGGDEAAEIVVGWRGADKDKKLGIKVYTRADDGWTAEHIDEKIACEDLKIADLDGDGKREIIAAGRATKNVVIYWNR